jgi:hypothetical protein
MISAGTLRLRSACPRRHGGTRRTGTPPTTVELLTLNPVLPHRSTGAELDPVLLAGAATLDARALEQLAVLLLRHPLAALLDDRTHYVRPLDITETCMVPDIRLLESDGGAGRLRNITRQPRSEANQRSGGRSGFPHPERDVAPITKAVGNGQAGAVLAPVIHYLVEALHSCSRMANLPTSTLLLTLLSVTAALVAATMMRSRIRR